MRNQSIGLGVVVLMFFLVVNANATLMKEHWSIAVIDTEEITINVDDKDYTFDSWEWNVYYHDDTSTQKPDGDTILIDIAGKPIWLEFSSVQFHYTLDKFDILITDSSGEKGVDAAVQADPWAANEDEIDAAIEEAKAGYSEARELLLAALAVIQEVEARKGDNYGITRISIFKELDVSPVPEPTTILLFGSGLVGLLGYGLRKKKR